MSAPSSSGIVSAALALAADDPEPGPVRIGKDWRGSVTATAGDGSDRQLHIASPGGGEFVLVRFGGARERPVAYPDAVPFVEDHAVWAGASALGSAAVWVHPPDPAAVAAGAVTDSVRADWDLESAVNVTGLFGRGGLNTVSLTRRGVRRGISIVSGHVVLMDSTVADSQQVPPAGTPRAPTGRAGE